MGGDSAVSIATRYRPDGPGDRTPAWGRFSVPVQTGPGTHPAFYTACTGSFPAAKRPGRDVNRSPASSAEVKERVELYLYFPLYLHVGYRVNYTFSFTLLKHCVQYIICHNIVCVLPRTCLFVRKIIRHWRNEVIGDWG